MPWPTAADERKEQATQPAEPSEDVADEAE